MNGYGEAFASSVREYLAMNNLTSLGSINGIILGELAQRFHDHSESKAKEAKRKERKFIPPTPQEVTDFSASIGYPLNGEAWCLHYEVKGWKTSGSASMKNWRACVHKWKAEGWTCGAASNPLKSNGMAPGTASLGALQMQLRSVETELEAMLYPGGTSMKCVPIPGTPERAKAEDLERQRLSLKSKIREFAN